MAKKLVVGIDLGGTKVMVAVLDEKLKVLNRVKMRTHGEEGPKATVLRMAKLVRKGLEEVAGGDKAKIDFVGVGAPGPLKPGTGVIVAAPNLGWKNVPLKKMLEKELKAPVNVDNDVNMGTYGEYIAGAARGKSLVVGLFPGTGIGGGIVIDGRVIQGASGSAGELGHIIVDPNGMLCGCGRRGCIETVASRLAVAKEVAVAAIRGQSPFIMGKYGHEHRRHEEQRLRRGHCGRRQGSGVNRPPCGVHAWHRGGEHHQHPLPRLHRPRRRPRRGHAEALPRGGPPRHRGLWHAADHPIREGRQRQLGRRCGGGRGGGVCARGIEE